MAALSSAAVVVDEVGIARDAAVRAAFLQDALDFEEADQVALRLLMSLLRRHEAAGEQGSVTLTAGDVAMLGEESVAGVSRTGQTDDLFEAHGGRSPGSSEQDDVQGGPPEQLHRLAERLYERMLRSDVNREVFTKRGAGFSGDLPASFRDVTLSDPQIAFRRERMVVHLYRLLNGASRWSAGFAKYLDWVGAIHTPAAGTKGINVEFTHLHALLGFLHTCMIEMVYEIPLDVAPGQDSAIPTQVRKRIIVALNKLFYIHGDFFAKHYVHTTPPVPESQAPYMAAAGVLCVIAVSVGAYFWKR